MILCYEYWVVFVIIVFFCYKFLLMKRVFFVWVDNFFRMVEVNVVFVIILISKVSKKKFDYMIYYVIKLYLFFLVLFMLFMFVYIVMIIYRIVVFVVLFFYFFVFRKVLYSGCSLSWECKCNGLFEMNFFL